ncbi:hypothetical protein TMatcc_010843 [Talaromyces marneffei ATCC 18224]
MRKHIHTDKLDCVEWPINFVLLSLQECWDPLHRNVPIPVGTDCVVPSTMNATNEIRRETIQLSLLQAPQHSITKLRSIEAKH